MKWLIFLIFLVSCIEAPVTDFASTSDDEARDSLRGRIRSRSLNDSSARCSESENCKKTCEDIYLKATDLDRCYNTSESKVKAVAEVFDILINPEKLSNLNDIEVKDFSQFLSIGYRAFLDLIDPVLRDEDGDRRNVYWEDLHAYDARSAQLVLEWIANEEKVARAVSSKDKDLDIVRHLFCIAGRSVSVNKQKNYMCKLWGVSSSECGQPQTPWTASEEGGYIWRTPWDTVDPPPFIISSPLRWVINFEREAWAWFVRMDDEPNPSPPPPRRKQNLWEFTVENPADTENCYDDPASLYIDHPASLYIGLTQGEYDGVGFSTYANKQENDQAESLSDKLIDEICGVNPLCRQFYRCPVWINYEGYSADVDDRKCGLYYQAVSVF